MGQDIHQNGQHRDAQKGAGNEGKPHFEQADEVKRQVNQKERLPK